MKTNVLESKGFSSLKAFWKQDLRAGFNVSLIALPLSLGIAIASGFPAIAGLFAAIIGGIFVSRFNGSFVSITGPAAGLIVVNLASIDRLGLGNNALGYQYTLAAIVMAGIFISLFGLLKAGKLGDFFPTAAVHGMLAAIGVIIMVKQLFVGIAMSAHGHEFYEVMSELPGALIHANPEVAIITLVSLLILIVYPKIKVRWIKSLPGPIWVILVAIPLEFLMDFEHVHAYHFLGADHKVGPQLLVHLPDRILDGVVLPNFGKIISSAFWISVASIALVTALESLLSAIAVDSFDPENRKSNLNKDLVGVGAGSSLSGFIGGLPVISEIVRSSANASSGAKTQWSNFFHATILLLFLLVGGPIISHIPLAALAAMLIFTGFRLASPKEFKHMFKLGKTEFTVFVSTLIMVLLTDLLIGVAFGVVLNLVLNFIRSKSVKDAIILKEIHTTGISGTMTIRIRGVLVFSNYLKFKKLVQKNKDVNICVDFADCRFIDHTVMHHLHGLQKDFKNKGQSFLLANLDDLKTKSNDPLAERFA
ncbi:MAG: MFS superfamily sulfate permease-like transporter [Bacteroidia bacterium]|jgi:MFS superfamily sulfate permease-like transporter